MRLKEFLQKAKASDPTITRVHYMRGKDKHQISWAHYKWYMDCDVVKWGIDTSEAIDPIARCKEEIKIAWCQLDEDECRISEKLWAETVKSQRAQRKEVGH